MMDLTPMYPNFGLIVLF